MLDELRTIVQSRIDIELERLQHMLSVVAPVRTRKRRFGELFEGRSITYSGEPPLRASSAALGEGRTCFAEIPIAEQREKKGEYEKWEDKDLAPGERKPQQR